MKQFTITSPTNSLAVVIYILMAFAGLIYTTNLSPNATVDRVLGNPLSDVWSTLLFLSASAAVYATLTAPRRRDPDTSLVMEMWACITLCTLLAWLEILLLGHRTDSGSLLANTLGFTAIFLLGFAFRAGQIFFERRALRRFRDSQP